MLLLDRNILKCSFIQVELEISPSLSLLTTSATTLLCHQHWQLHSLAAVNIQQLGTPQTLPNILSSLGSLICILWPFETKNWEVLLRCLHPFTVKPALSAGFARNAGWTGNLCSHSFNAGHWSVWPWCGFALSGDALHHQNHGLLPRSRILTVMPLCTQHRTPGSCST